ncbi:MAG: TrkA family potassium uptake protein [Sedimentisphaerales bacterium]|nr:TrkA family potassium uptake protein [Sedimentisphaerales bacterium]
MASKNNMYVIVIGCGRLGSFLANMLSNEGHSIVVIDIKPIAFNALAPDQFSGFKIEGDATELGILKQAKIDKADVLIGATHDENVNIMAAQIAKNRFDVPRVFVRILDPNKESFCKTIGIECVCPTSMAAEKMITALREKPES